LFKPDNDTVDRADERRCRPHGKPEKPIRTKRAG